MRDVSAELWLKRKEGVEGGGGGGGSGGWGGRRDPRL